MMQSVPASLTSRLPARARPTHWPLRLLPDEVDEHRNLGCQNYDRCLSYAILKVWSNFTCRYCPLFTRREGS